MREEIIGGQRLILGDCREVLPTIETGSADCGVTDPPYPGIKRSYGYWTEEEWHSMMDVVVPECRRVLTPTGSAVYVLQPNSEKVGRMRPWLWEFMAKWTREWGMVQDAWWWNSTALTTGEGHKRGLMKASVKAAVWLGEPDCFRDQSSVLWEASDRVKSGRWGDRALRYRPSGAQVRERQMCEAAIRRGGTTPPNLLPIANADSTTSAGAHGHGAGTPLALCDWWLRYICPPDGTVLEPFMGSGTVNVAAELQGKRGIGVEAIPEYFEIACRRVEAAAKQREQDAAQLTLEVGA